MNISKSQSALLSLLGHNLFGAPLNLEENIDFSEVFCEGRAQAVVLCAFQNYKNLPIDEKTRADLQSYIKSITLTNMLCFKNHSRLHALMEKNDISYCAIKGAASAHYYPDPLMRSMGDVDFFVEGDDVDKALEIFDSMGFERSETNHRYHVSVSKGNSHFEVHFKPIGGYEGEVGERVQECWRGICDNSVMIDDEIVQCKIPDTFTHGFILLTHLQSHLLSEGVGLRHLCDWAVFANRFSNEEFVEIFEQKLKKVGIWRLAQLLSLASHRSLGMPYKAWMGEDFDTADALFYDIISGGNFGRKDMQRSYEGLFISDKNTRKAKGNRISHIFTSLNMIVDGHWKSAKKCKILYPVGWVFFSIRFLFRVICGKRKANVVSVYQNSGKRKELYESLNLFVPEE